MIVTLKDDGYVDSFAVVGSLENGIEVDFNGHIWELLANPSAFKIVDGVLTLDEDKLNSDKESTELNELRILREKECFPLINRGALWYARLTDEQMGELDLWYQKWLDVTKTKEIPIKPIWLKKG